MFYCIACARAPQQLLCSGKIPHVYYRYVKDTFQITRSYPFWQFPGETANSPIVFSLQCRMLLIIGRSELEKCIWIVSIQYTTSAGRRAGPDRLHAGLFNRPAPGAIEL